MTKNSSEGGGGLVPVARSATHPAIEVLDADREFVQLDIDHPDPTTVIIQLWADAGGDPAP